MGKWSTYQLRGGGQQAAAPLPVPDVFNLTTSELSWSVAGVVPDQAQLEESPDGSTGWTIEAVVPWTPSDYVVPILNNFYRVTGLDISNNPVTALSAVIQVG